ncbi:putative L-ascorbate peroxidase 6 [Morella rubra]|uniref:Putative L-ascorbate peroxidase 6 n=1 Tax=Morella rubra TaxID=262757 RepID=A0A6A1V1Z4_9ROSI|nr:putative L-ascorbate peroxidase 6 [Morella rubra]
MVAMGEVSAFDINGRGDHCETKQVGEDEEEDEMFGSMFAFSEEGCLFSARNRSCKSSRRRAVAFIATLPSLLVLNESLLEGFGANAAGPATSEYLVINEELRKVLSKGKVAGVLRLVFHAAGTFDMDENSGSKLWHWFNGTIVVAEDSQLKPSAGTSSQVVDEASTNQFELEDSVDDNRFFFVIHCGQTIWEWDLYSYNF